MPRRRKKSVADDIWDGFVELCMIGPVVAFGLFVLIAGVVPALLGMGPPKAGSASSPFQPLAVVVAIGTLLAWAIGLSKRQKRRTLLDSRSGPQSLRHMSWQDFELLVGEAYRRQGYAVEETGGGGADSGIDLILHRNGETTLVQCKRWKTYKVDVKIVRELYGVMAAENAHRGVVATCGRYTRDALAFAEGKPLELLDGPGLWRLVEQVKRDQSAPAISDAALGSSNIAGTPNKLICPECGSTLVLRTARKGAHAGSQFYGCSQYPKCRFIRDESSSVQA